MFNEFLWINVNRKWVNSLNKEKSCSLLLGLLLSFLSLWLLLFFRSGRVFFQLFQSIHRHLGSSGDACGKLVSPSSESYLAALALPDSTWYSLDGSLHYHSKVPFHMPGRRTWRVVGVRTSSRFFWLHHRILFRTFRRYRLSLFFWPLWIKIIEILSINRFYKIY